MDKTRFSRRRLIENELMLRQKNEAAKDAIYKYYSDEADVEHAPLEFYCECSNDDCEQRVEMTIKEYENFHERNDRFIVLRGHEIDDLERVVRRYDEYVIVQKYDLPK